MHGIHGKCVISPAARLPSIGGDGVIACRRPHFGGYAGGTIVFPQSFACTNKRGEDYAHIAAKILPSLRLSPPFGYADRYFPCTIEVEYAWIAAQPLRSVPRGRHRRVRVIASTGWALGEGNVPRPFVHAWIRGGGRA